MSTPSDIVNRALDAIGRDDLIIGDIEEGTEAANPMLRTYDPAMRQLLRCAHWAFARKAVPMVMLADSTGQTVGVGTNVIAPWAYEYALPTDCMQARFVPRNYLNPNLTVPGNISLPSTPQTTVSQPPFGYVMRLTPAPFLISSETNYPVDPSSNWQELQGVSPNSRTVVLTNVNQATLVYTAFMPYPSTWDQLFEQALVDLLTARMALTLSKDKKFGLELRDRAIVSLKDSITQARVASANESAFPITTDSIPDWTRARRSGGWGGSNGFGGLGFGGGGCGVLGYGWNSLSLGDGNIF